MPVMVPIIVDSAALDTPMVVDGKLLGYISVESRSPSCTVSISQVVVSTALQGNLVT